MIFEIGKTYKHTTGKQMTIIGRLKTHNYGECLIGEEVDTGELLPVGEQEDNAVNWVESDDKVSLCDSFVNVTFPYVVPDKPEYVYKNKEVEECEEIKKLSERIEDIEKEIKKEKEEEIEKLKAEIKMYHLQRKLKEIELY